MRKMRVQCATREELALNAELEAERDAASVRSGGAATLGAKRFTFFRRTPQGNNWHDLTDDDVLGYAVLVTLALPAGPSRYYIHEAVIRVPTMWVGNVAAGVTNYYVHCARPFTTTVGTAVDNKTLNITGSFFCQQNNLTHVCAHAALRCAVNSSSSYNGPKLTNQLINDILGIDHSAANRVGLYEGETGSGGGLSTDQIIQIVQHIGWNTHVADFISNPAIDYGDFVYPSIESGHPVILGVNAPHVAHVVAVIGHTSNTDRWTPEAHHGYGGFPISPYISTSAWADHFIVSDDNFGMYVTLPTDAIRNVIVPKYNPNLHASLAIGLVPAQVTISGYAVEQSAAAVANKLIRLIAPTPDNRWLTYLKSHRLVCRTLLREKQSYLDFMANITDDSNQKLTAAEIAVLGNSLPPLFWVTEITVPNLYTGNKHKLGDVITGSNITPQQYTSGQMTLFAWLPGIAFGSPGLVAPPVGWSLFGHIPLLRNAALASPAEW
jgi:hypothetical protein